MQPPVDVIHRQIGGNATVSIDRMQLTNKERRNPIMNIADRIQNLRKNKGISQEQLADKIGVSRQSVSKWESEQSTPDIEKVILMSDFFEVTTDYILKGIEPADGGTKKPDMRIFALVGTGVNVIGLIAAIMVWIEKREPIAVAIGLMIMAVGCMIFGIGKLAGPDNRKTSCVFGILNVWTLSLIPLSCTFNALQGILGGHWWTFAPTPQLGNSLWAYGLCWGCYVVIGVAIDMVLLNRMKR